MAGDTPEVPEGAAVLPLIPPELGVHPRAAIELVLVDPAVAATRSVAAARGEQRRGDDRAPHDVGFCRSTGVV